MSHFTYRLDHVQLAMPAGGEDRARTFYGEALGLEEEPKPADLAARGGVWFRRDHVRIHLGVDPSFVPAKKAHAALRVDSYPDLLARLQQLGVAVTPDALPFEGKAHCYVEDPFGNRLELIDAW